MTLKFTHQKDRIIKFLHYRKAIKKGKEYHDKIFKSFDWKKWLKTPPITKEHLYFNDVVDGPNYEKNRAYYAEPFDSDENYLRTVEERWNDSDLQNRMNLFLRPKIRKLCNRKVRYLKKSKRYKKNYDTHC